MTRILSLSMIVVLGFASSARAQRCFGMGSFDGAPLQVGTGAAFTKGINAFGGSVTGGSDSLFAGGSVGYQNYSDLRLHAMTLGGMAGTDRTVDGGGRVHVCPNVSVAYIMGPNVGDLKLNTLGISPGASVGIVASETDQLAVIPTFGVSVIYERTRLKFGGLGSESVSDTSGTVSLGVGFLFNKRTAIVPAIVIPVAREGADPIFSLGVGFNFAR